MDWDCRCLKVQTIVVTEIYYDSSTKKGQVDYKLTEQIKEKYKKAKVLIRKGRFLLPRWSLEYIKCGNETGRTDRCTRIIPNSVHIQLCK